MTISDMAKEWLNFASNDLIVAKHSLEDLYPKQTYIAAYLSQQCAEKSLKAFLVANNIDPPRIHNLEELAKLCGNIDKIFLELQDDCQRINPYGVASRYPREIAIDETIAKTLIERAQKIYDFCVETINALFQEQEKGKNEH